MRTAFRNELEQLRLQVEVMAVRVGENLDRTQRVLVAGDAQAAREAIAADDDIDAMLVSLTERCYDLLAREAPVASDLRLIVSVLRLLEELERIGDLALRVVKSAPAHPDLNRHPSLLGTLQDMGETARSLFAGAVRAWSTKDLDLGQAVAAQAHEMDVHYAALLRDILDLHDSDATSVAVTSVLVGRALERIADHTVIIVERLRYLVTGDPAHLAAEVR